RSNTIYSSIFFFSERESLAAATSPPINRGTSANRNSRTIVPEFRTFIRLCISLPGELSSLKCSDVQDKDPQFLEEIRAVHARVRGSILSGVHSGTQETGTQEAQEAQEDAHILVPLVLLVFPFRLTAAMYEPRWYRG